MLTIEIDTEVLDEFPHEIRGDLLSRVLTVAGNRIRLNSTDGVLTTPDGTPVGTYRFTA